MENSGAVIPKGPWRPAPPRRQPLPQLSSDVPAIFLSWDRSVCAASRPSLPYPGLFPVRTWHPVGPEWSTCGSGSWAEPLLEGLHLGSAVSPHWKWGRGQRPGASIRVTPWEHFFSVKSLPWNCWKECAILLVWALISQWKSGLTYQIPVSLFTRGQPALSPCSPGMEIGPCRFSVTSSVRLCAIR